MKVALLCGPCPARECGVGDYTVCLADALNQRGVEAHVISSDKWNVLGAIKNLEASGAPKFDVLHVQYPTVGFGRALVPQVLALLHGCVVTIHEASQAHILRKLSLLPFSVRAKRLVFTSEYERQFATRWAPWISQVSCVIPITSNIRVFEGPSERTDIDCQRLLGTRYFRLDGSVDCALDEIKDLEQRLITPADRFDLTPAVAWLHATLKAPHA